MFLTEPTKPEIEAIKKALEDFNELRKKKFGDGKIRGGLLPYPENNLPRLPDYTPRPWGTCPHCDRCPECGRPNYPRTHLIWY